jgi:hypothetical protein
VILGKGAAFFGPFPAASSKIFLFSMVHLLSFRVQELNKFYKNANVVNNKPFMKRSVTLIELMIGCTLLSVLLSLLFGLLREMKLGEKEILGERERLLLLERFEIRLDQLLLKSVAAQKEGNPVFYTDQEGGLVFITEVGATYDPPLVDRVLCRLLHQDGALIAESWPDPEKFGTSPQIMRREVILPKVEKISWKFFSPPKPDVIINGPRVGENEEKQEPPVDEWLDEWKVGYQKIPPLLQLTVVRDKDEVLTYMTFLPATGMPLELTK